MYQQSRFIDFAVNHMKFIDNHISIEIKYTFFIMTNGSVCKLPDKLSTQNQTQKHKKNK